MPSTSQPRNPFLPEDESESDSDSDLDSDSEVLSNY
jgi:hypothetical protein